MVDWSAVGAGGGETEDDDGVVDEPVGAVAPVAEVVSATVDVGVWVGAVGPPVVGAAGVVPDTVPVVAPVTGSVVVDGVDPATVPPVVV
jgi:hypothetical protein